MSKMQKNSTIDIRNDDAMEVETKEEPLEWNGENLSMQIPQGINHTCGLRNLGNTCYMNSVVQSLAHVRPLAAFLISDWATVTSPGAGAQLRSDLAKSRRKFLRDLAETMRTLWSGKYRDFAARQLMAALIDTVPEFRVHWQQDAEEALTYALNNLHDDLFVPVPKELHPANAVLLKLEKERKQLDQDARARAIKKTEEEDEETRRKKEEQSRISQCYEPYKRSIVSDTFQALLAQRVTCSKCESTSLTVQESFNLPLELPSKMQTKTLSSNGNGNGSANDSRAAASTSKATLKNIPSNTSLDQIISNSPKLPNSAVSSSTLDSPSTSGGIFSSALSSLKSVFSWTSHSLTLEQCLRSFFSPETLKGDEQYYCETCRCKEDASKFHEIVHLPEVLCFQLKRFNKNRGTFGLGSAKNSTSVRFPVEGLDMSPYCGPDSAMDASSCMYDLISVVRHSGGADSGHYIATCKSQVNGRWYEFDDEFVTSIGSTEQLQSNDAYLLFYARRPAQMDVERRTKALKLLRAPRVGDSDRIYLSRYWAMKFETMAQPGPLDNYSFACEHGGVAMPALRDVRDRVIVLPISVLKELEGLYHGSYPHSHLGNLDACEQCKETFEALSARRAAELEECSELLKQSSNNAWYVIPRSWFQKWLNFVHNDCGPLGRGPWEGSNPPPQIDTVSLFSKDGKELKEKLKLDVHYVVVNRAVFKFWERIYGMNGPVLPRSGRDVYSAAVSNDDPPAEVDAGMQEDEPSL